MPITCQICNREFTKMITNSHTKSHGVTTEQYKEKFGPDSMSCPEYRALRSAESKGANNCNYGKTLSDEAKKRISDANKGANPSKQGKVRTESHKRKISDAAKARWENPGFRELHSGKSVSDETKAKISDSLRGRKSNPEVTARAVATRMANHIPGSRKGKYKPSPATLLKTKLGLEKARSIRKADSLKRRHELAAMIDAELLSAPDAKFVRFKCLTCSNIFSRTPQFLTDAKFTTTACRVCNPKKMGVSQARLQELIQDAIGRPLESNNRSILGCKELDIYDPETRVAVEYCGLYWHSSAYDDNHYRHLEKQQASEAVGVKLITVFEDEFMDRPEVVVSRIAAAMGKKSAVYYARKCYMRELTPKEANTFLNQYHLQGSGRSNFRVGLFHDGLLLSVMTFSESNISRGLRDWEINRYATVVGVTVVGGASKLLAAFVKAVNPRKVVSYSDNRWGSGAVYGAIGFTLESTGTPNYWYIDGASRIHRYALRKNETDDQKKTEWENRLDQGYLRVWDCGHTRWVLER